MAGRLARWSEIGSPKAAGLYELADGSKVEVTEHVITSLGLMNDDDVVELVDFTQPGTADCSREYKVNGRAKRAVRRTQSG